MSNNEMLKLLCLRLVGNEFETVHDAEQALEQFEKLTTPAAVLELIEIAQKATVASHERRPLEIIARNKSN